MRLQIDQHRRVRHEFLRRPPSSLRRLLDGDHRRDVAYPLLQLRDHAAMPLLLIRGGLLRCCCRFKSRGVGAVAGGMRFRNAGLHRDAELRRAELSCRHSLVFWNTEVIRFVVHKSDVLQLFQNGNGDAAIGRGRMEWAIASNGSDIVREGGGHF